MYDYSLLTFNKKQLQNLNKSLGQYINYYFRIDDIQVITFDERILMSNVILQINHHYKGLIEHG